MMKIIHSTVLSIFLVASPAAHCFTDSDTLQFEDNASNSTSKSLDFFVIGDWGQGDSNQRNVANAMATEASQNPINFILSVGDNFYPHGVRSINDKRWQTSSPNH